MAAKKDQELKRLRVIELGAENFMRVRAVRIRPKGAVTQITGRNGQGKSSVLTALWSTLAGKAAVHKVPIKKGETEGKAWVELGVGGEVMLRATQHFTLKEEGGAYDGDYTRRIVLEGADGARFNKPQEVLDALYAPIAADPLEFLRLKPADKVEVLKKLVPGVDFADIAQRRAAAFRQRTDIGRDRDRAAARGAGIVVPPGAPTKLIDLQDLAAELREAADFNATVDKRAAGREAARNERDLKLDAIERLQAQIKTLQAEANAIDEKLASAGDLPPKIDIAAIEVSFKDASESNKVAALAAQKAEALKEAEAAGAAYDELTAEIDKLDAAKRAAIDAAKLPVAGLGFDDDEVTLNGLPFEQASTAEQLRASAGIVMASNPDLRVMIIREGSLLDEDSLELLTSIAETSDFDVFLERVTGGEKVGVVIEDGEVAGG